MMTGPMNVTFRCPHCDQISHAEFEPRFAELACPACRPSWPIPPGAVTAQTSSRSA